MPIAPLLPFTIPHRDEVDPAHALQARPDKIDWSVAMLAGAGWGWLVDAAVTAQTTPDLTVAVSDGVVQFGPDLLAVPAADVAVSPDTVSPRFVLIGTDRLEIASIARTGSTVHLELSLSPLGASWRVGDRVVVKCSDNRADTPPAGALLTAVGASSIEYAVGASGTIATVAATGGVVHVGAIHGNPSAGDKPPFPALPLNGFVVLAAVLVAPNATTIEDADVVDKRSPILGNIPRTIDPTSFPYCAKGDGVTYDGDVIEWAKTDAHQRRMTLHLPAGKTFLMTNGTTNKVLTWDFADKLGYSRVSSDFKGAAKLLYTSPFAMNTSIDGTLPTAIGDPGGRVPMFAVEATGTGKVQGALIWDGIDLEGPKPKGYITDGEERNAGWAFRMSRRNVIANCTITGFHSGLVYRIDCDHNFAFSVEVASCWYGAYSSWNQPLVSDAVAGGDHVQVYVELSSNAHSGWAADAAAVIFDSSVVSGHWGTSGFGWSREAGPIGDIVLDATATYARDATHGEVTIDTKVGATASPWPGLVIDPAYGFKVGDPIDLSGLATAIGGGFHFGNDPAGKRSDSGIITSLVGNVLKISMGSYDATSAGARGAFAVTGSAVGTTTRPVGGGSVAHIWNGSPWMLQIEMLDTSLEGCTVANIFDFAHNSEMNTCYGYWQFHGIEVIGRNTGNARGYAPLHVTSATRKWTFGGGTELAPIDGDVYTVSLLVAAGHGIKKGSIIFYDASPETANANYATVATKTGTRTAAKQLTVTTRFGSGTDVRLIVGTTLNGPGVPSGTRVTACDAAGVVLTLDKDITSPAASTFVFTDDAPPVAAQGWAANGSRARGKWEVTFVDATHIEFIQAYKTTSSSPNLYTGTAANPYVVLGGGVGQVCSIYVGEMDRNTDLTINAQHEGQSGEGLAEIQWVVRRLRDNEIRMSNGIAPRVLTQAGYNDADATDPCNTIIWAGGSKFRITHTAEDCFPMALMEANLKDDCRLFRTGGLPSGFAAYSALANDFVTLLQEGPSKPKPIDYGGALSVATFAQGDKLVGDGSAGHEGFVKKATGASEVVVARARSAAVSTGFGTFVTRLRAVISAPTAGSGSGTRETTIASNNTWSPNVDTTDIFTVTAQAVAVTTIANPVFTTPATGQILRIRVKDNGTTRAMTWSGTQWRAGTALPLPTTTPAGLTMYLTFIYNATDTKWDLLGRVDI